MIVVRATTAAGELYESQDDITVANGLSVAGVAPDVKGTLAPGVERTGPTSTRHFSQQDSITIV